MVMAMKTTVGNPLRKLVLIKLADNANDTGECWPSYKDIADQCEIAKSTVREHIRALVEVGLVSIEHRTGPKGHKSNMYRLHLCRQAAQPTDNTACAGRRRTLCREAAPEPVIEPIKKIKPPPPPTPSASNAVEEVEEVEEYIQRETDRAANAGEIRTTRQTYAAAVRRKITNEGGRLTPERREQLEQWRSPPTAPCTIPVFIPNAQSESIGEAKIQDHEIRARTLASLPPWEQEIVRTREYLKETCGE